MKVCKEGVVWFRSFSSEFETADVMKELNKFDFNDRKVRHVEVFSIFYFLSSYVILYMTVVMHYGRGFSQKCGQFLRLSNLLTS